MGSRATPPAWAEVSLSALRANYKALQALAVGSQVLPVVKANAYGHGLVEASKAFLSAGADFLGVALVQEGVALRKAGVTCPILVLVPTLEPEIPELLKYKLTPQVSTLEGAKALSKVAQKMGIKKVQVHVKMDTGMARVGLRVALFKDGIEAIRKVPGLEVTGVYTHLATADWTDPKYAWNQITLFRQALDEARLESGGAFRPATHVANSASLITYYPQSKGTWVRPGIALYGVYPNPDFKDRVQLTPAMQVKTRIVQVKDLAKGESVSYGRTYTAAQRIRVATLALGYADGVLRSLSNQGLFLIRGKRVPILGRVCMDMTMVDVSKAPGAKLGDEAVFFGGSGAAFLGVEEQAQRAGTISYELLTAVGQRVKRVYVR